LTGEGTDAVHRHGPRKRTIQYSAAHVWGTADISFKCREY
jgi:hypothetical protein